MSHPLSTTTMRAGSLGQPLAIAGGALFVALAAQVAVPLPFTPVPATLQPGAVLVVAGLLGPRLGTASLVLYLVLGAAGLPVFAPGGLPGAARLFGPSGGYLLAYPAAAGLVGWLTAAGSPPARFWLGLIAGMLLIHLGGVAQLAALSGSLEHAVRAGSLPFLAADALKVGVAGLIVRRLGQKPPTPV